MRFLRNSLLLLFFFLCFLTREESIINYDIHSIAYSGNPSIMKSEEGIGSIEFPDYQIKRIIKQGILTSILDQGYVGFLPLSYQLDDPYGNIVLAGHNRKNAFAFLHDLKLGDTILLNTREKTFSFHIIKIDIISKTDYQYFELSNYEKILTLITCTNHDRQRLVIRAK